jgi:hypothetical protein
MTRTLILLAVVAVLLAGVAIGAAESRLEGTVAATTMTACDLKPGSCEGTLTLETKAGGAPATVTVKVPKGTSIKKGNQHLFLPGLKDQTVVITHVEDKGQRVARSIEVKTAK